MKWRIYYGDGSLYSDGDGSPFDAPGRDVQAIAVEDAQVGRTIHSRRDFYWWSSIGWWGGDLFGLYDYLLTPGPRKVIFGRSLPGRRVR
jgi:hypothetical protein